MNRNRLFSFFCLLALAAGTLSSLASAQRTLKHDLTRYRYKNRLLLVFAPSKSDPRWKKQNALLAHSREAFQDRDLLRFDYFGTADQAVRVHYGVEPGQFRVLLIGKDGHVASDSQTPIGLSELAGQIDNMPMRRDEMRQRGQK